MPLPKTVKVGGHRIKIRPNNNIKHYGQYDRQAGEIQVRTNTSPSQVAATLLHEILHACFMEQGLHVGPLKAHEEKIVTALETLLYQVFVDNPSVMKFIIGKKK